MKTNTSGQCIYLQKQCTPKMLEKQQSFLNNLQKHSQTRSLTRHSCLQRQKSRTSVSKQRSPVLILSKHDDFSYNNSADVTDAKFRRLVLKHTKLGFIKNLSKFTFNKTNTCDQHAHGNGDIFNNKHVRVSRDNIFYNTVSPISITYDKELLERTINKDEFILGGLLGAGGFGSVYLGKFKEHTVAIKVMHKYTKNPAAQLESFKAELLAMRFNHPNIVKTLAATHIDTFDDGAWVVMEYIDGCTLLRLINDVVEDLSAKRRQKFSIQIASALAYAHKNKIAHLDLKPANILISKNDNCKVGDFGCSQILDFESGVISPTNRSMLTGTFAYRAPELLRGEPPTFKADVYSYGITMWQMKSRTNPFADQYPHVVIYGIVAKGLRPTDSNPFETDPFELSYKELYSKCWSTCPLVRPTVQELLNCMMEIWKIC